MPVSLNADIGEGFGIYGFGDDGALMRVLTDVNIACGFHAGDPSIMRRSVDVAVEKGLGIGAHVSYPDLRGFGRREMALTSAEVYDDTVYQIGALAGVCGAAGGRVAYVKPHGALYHAGWRRSEIAQAVVTAMVDSAGQLALVCPPESQLDIAARAHGVRVVAEGYIDRSYSDDGGLTPRTHALALIHDPDEAGSRALRMVRDHETVSYNGRVLPLRVHTLCVHSDSPNAARMAADVRRRLGEAGITVASPFLG